MQNSQLSSVDIPHLQGNSSGSVVERDVFRYGKAQHGDFGAVYVSLIAFPSVCSSWTVFSADSGPLPGRPFLFCVPISNIFHEIGGPYI